MISPIEIEIEIGRFSRITRWHIRRVLKFINPADLDGLQIIRVINECPDDPEYLSVPRYLPGFLYNGQYLKKAAGRPAEIVMYANDIYFGIPCLLMSTTVATLKLARTLAHEIAHHVVQTRGYIIDETEKFTPFDGSRNPEEESAANAYANDVIKRMSHRLSYRLGRLLSAALSSILHRAGLRDYWHRRYARAASRLARAHSLDPQNEEAGQAFRHAVEKLKVDGSSALTGEQLDWLLTRYNRAPSKTGELYINKLQGRSY